METSINTRLTWAVPVKPDLLGKSLQAFKETLPTLRALRLCHRFGKGSKAYITKLPIEVERIIEGFVPLCRSTLWQSFFWEENFNHFEKRCEPADHVEECYLDIWEDVESELHEELCESCQTDGTFDNELNCTSDCHFEVHMKMNQRIQENYDHAFEVCDNFSRAWENSIAQKADGHFVQYDQVSLRSPQPGRPLNKGRSSFSISDLVRTSLIHESMRPAAPGRTRRSIYGTSRMSYKPRSAT